MLSSKLIGLFYKLSGYERAALRRWVQSPYHNRRGDVIALFNYLQEADPMEPSQLHREKIFAAVYTNEIFDEPRLRYAMSFLVQVIEDFLVVENCLATKSFIINYLRSNILDSNCPMLTNTASSALSSICTNNRYGTAKTRFIRINWLGIVFRRRNNPNAIKTAVCRCFLMIWTAILLPRNSNKHAACWRTKLFIKSNTIWGYLRQ